MDFQQNGLEIAVIGLAGKYPKSKTINDFWHHLVNGVELTSPFDDTLSDNKNVGSVLADVDQFDAAFFGFNPAEAAAMDPQHRLFLECAWEALENAGYRSDTEEKTIGVFAGVGMGTYLLYNLNSNPNFLKSRGFLQTLVGVDKDYLATRVSYKLNLKGPSLIVGTACSSSLVAVHLACQSLLSGECDMALAAGVAIKIPQNALTLSPEEIISPDGHCRAFDCNAQGTIGGNGIGVVVLKRLEDAIADRDCIYAVVKGSAINNDGAMKVGYTAPSQEGQTKVIRAAQIMAEIDPETITYLETHGTGTPLGDPIEVAAMTQAFRTTTSSRQFCAIGSVKTNVGHLDAAAGITGFIKTVLALHHQQIPPSLNFESPNPQIDFENSPFYVNTQLRDWKTNGCPRRAAVSSFGFGGTNAHVILEESPISALSPENSPSPRPYQLLILSGKTSLAQKTAIVNLCEHFQQTPDLNLADVAYTLGMGRWEFNHRCCFIAQTVEDATEALKSGDILTGTAQESSPPVIFLFSGQGSQYVNMAKDLYCNEPLFREECDRCFAYLQSKHDLDLYSILFPDEIESYSTTDTVLASEIQENRDELGVSSPLEQKNKNSADNIHSSEDNFLSDSDNIEQKNRNSADNIHSIEETLKQTEIAQPALFVIEYALAKLWMSWGVQPQAMIGHSIGEYVAATIAEVFTLEEALSIVAIRGKLMQQQPKGAMLVVNLSIEALAPFLCENLSLAVCNSPSLNVISGTIEAVKTLEYELIEQDVIVQPLHTSHAFHSPMMEGAIAPLVEQLQKIKLKPPQIPFISNVTGTWITTEAATDPNYWGQHLRQMVQFSQGIGQLLSDDKAIFLEVGAGRTLSTLTRQQASDRLILSSLPHPKDNLSDEQCLLKALGQLWVNGVNIDWSSFYAQPSYPYHRVPLPTYPFKRQRYWIDAPSNGQTREIEANSALFSPTQSNISSTHSQTQGLKETDERLHLEAKSDISSTHSQTHLDRLSKKSDLGEWFYIPSWKRSIVPKLPEIAKKRCWVIFCEQQSYLEDSHLNLGIAIIQELQQQGHRVIQVEIGETYQKNKDIFTLNPSDRTHYESLVQDILSIDRSPIFAHLWTLRTDLSLEEGQTLGFYSLLYLAQAIAQSNNSDSIHIGVVSRDLQDVTGVEKIQPEKATILGACRVIPQEFANVTCSSFDIDSLSTDKRANEPLIHHLIADLTTQTETSANSIIAYRGNYRWLPTDEPLYLTPTNQHIPLLSQGIYLITGGLGGIGLSIAEYLAKTVQAKLVLLNRSVFPSRQEWEYYSTDDKIKHKIEKIQQLEAMGAEILILSADIADSEQMQTIKEQIEQTFGQVQGIFHTAGVAGDGIIPLKTVEQIEKVLRPKVQGTLVLQKIYQDTPLDFWVLFSSLSAYLGGIGQVDYCAANCFLDAFAHSQASNSNFPIISINWDMWQEIGMGADLSHLPDVLKQERQIALKTGILPAEGLDCLHRILRSGYHHVIVSPKDWQTVQKNPPMSQMIAQVDTKPPSTPSTLSNHGRSLQSTSYVAPRTAIEQGIAQLWQEQLGIEKIGVNDDFFELGGHSLLAVRVVSQLRTLYDIDLSLRSVLSETPTVAQLAEVITQKLSLQDNSGDLDRLLSEIEQLSEDEVKHLLDQ